MPKGNWKSTRNRIPDDEKVELKLKIVEDRIAGKCNYLIAKERGISPITSEKLYLEALKESVAVDPVLLLVRERRRIETVYDKVTRDMLASKCKAVDFVAIAKLANAYNGVDLLLDTIAPEELPAMMRIEVKTVPFEKPEQLEQSINQAGFNTNNIG